MEIYSPKATKEYMGKIDRIISLLQPPRMEESITHKGS